MKDVLLLLYTWTLQILNLQVNKILKANNTEDDTKEKCNKILLSPAEANLESKWPKAQE